MRYREAVSKPSIILSQLKNGYITPEASEVLTQVFPETKNKLMEEFINEASKKDSIPVEKRVEIYKIFGIKMDNFMDGPAFVELQSESNTQAQETANGGPIQNPNNIYKGNLDKKENTLGNSTVSAE